MRNTDMSPGREPLKYAGKVYPVAFTLDAVDRICAEKGCSVDKIVDLIRNTSAPDFRHNVVIIAAALINAAVDEHNEDFPEDAWLQIDAAKMARRLTMLQFSELYSAIANAYIKGFISEVGEKDDDDISADPNLRSGRR